MVNGQKMSKSLGNFFTLRDLLEKGCDPMAVRYVLMSTHYRQPLNFTLESVEAAKTSIRRLKDFRIRLKESGAKADPPELAAALEKGKNGFDAALADDLNTSAALAALFDMVRDVNKLELSPPAPTRPPRCSRVSTKSWASSARRKRNRPTPRSSPSSAAAKKPAPGATSRPPTTSAPNSKPKASSSRTRPAGRDGSERNMGRLFSYSPAM